MLGLQEDTEPRNMMPAMLNMFIRTFADARLFCNGRAFLSYLIKCCCTTWLILIVNDCHSFIFSEYWHVASLFSKAVTVNDGIKPFFRQGKLFSICPVAGLAARKELFFIPSAVVAVF